MQNECHGSCAGHKVFSKTRRAQYTFVFLTALPLMNFQALDLIRNCTNHCQALSKAWMPLHSWPRLAPLLPSWTG